MPRVTFLPSNEIHEVLEGTPILDAALENGLFVEHECGGNCACSTCCVDILAGLEHLSPIDDDEEDTLDLRTDRRDTHRLACQAIILGDCAIRLNEG